MGNGKLVAITGNIGSGKSTVLKLFEDLGALTIDVDKIAHKIIENNLSIISKLENLFNVNLKKPDNTLDKDKLREIVFKDKDKLKILNKLTHPLIIEETKKNIYALRKQYPNKLILVEVPLLFETNRAKEFDYVIVVYCSDKIAIERAKNRSDIDLETLKNIQLSQMSIEEKKKMADFVIDNSGPIENTKKMVEEIYNKLTK